MKNTNNKNYWEKIKNKKKDKPLFFVHTPKCGGNFVKNILRELNINHKKGHSLAEKNDGLTFTVIRNPIERYESLMNYRLNESKPRKDWPKLLNYVWEDKTITLNEIIGKMSDDEILNFRPYKTLRHYSKNIDIFITIDKLEEFLLFFDYKFNIENFKKKNVSKKLRGKFNEFTKNRISELYSDDMNLYKQVILD